MNAQVRARDKFLELGGTGGEIGQAFAVGGPTRVPMLRTPESDL